MIKLNERLNQILAQTISEKIKTILEEYIFEPNNTVNRETIKAKVSNLLDEAKEQFIKEHKSFVIGEQVVPAHLLEPKVEVYPDRFNDTNVVCSFNKDAQAMVDEIFKDIE